MNPPIPPAALRQRRDLTLAAVWCATGVYLVAALIAMVVLAPRVPYADQWRFYARLIAQSFPTNVLAADNGHREVLPNLLRLAELSWFGANQGLQIVLGMLLALTSVLVLSGALWRDSASRTARTCAIFVGVFGIVWLGNERALAHANESVHAYLVIMLLLIGLRLVARSVPQAEVLRATAATACALAATFSFGSGIACLPAFMLVLGLRRAPRRAWWPVAIGLLVGLALYVGAGAATTTLSFDPFVQISLVLRWLAAPFVYLLWPLLDPHVAAQLPPGVLRSIAMALAQIWSAVFGDVARSVWPQTVLGAGGVLAFALACRRAWREAYAESIGLRVALGVAGFALLVGGMIALSRTSYFVLLPEQLQASRYLVWSSVFWSGLLSATLLRNGAQTQARGNLLVALALAVAAAPSQVWMGQLALHMRTAAEQVALGGVVGVLDRDEPLGETQFSELANALPLLEQRGAAMYAWPETAMLGQHPPETALRPLSATDLRTCAVVNRFDGDGRLVEMRVSGASNSRLLVMDEAGRVVGLVLRYPPRGADAWRGWLRGDTADDALKIAERRW